MSKLQNPIGWCDDTGNKFIGCNKVSPGCKNCYAETGTAARVLRARGIETWGPQGIRIAVADFIAKLRRLNELCICDRCHETMPFSPVAVLPSRGFHIACGGKIRRIRFFADSNSDWLDVRWTIETLAEFLNEIRLAPNVDVILLTKRLENWRDRVDDAFGTLPPNPERDDWWTGWLDGQKPPQNVWLGVSVENQEMADKRREALQAIPAQTRFVSFEPALSEVNWAGWDFIDWMIVGGESGPSRRDCGVDVLLEAIEDCQQAGIPVYVKQDCALKSGRQGRIPDEIWKLKQFPHP